MPDTTPQPAVLPITGPGEEDWLSPAEVSSLSHQAVVDRIVALKPLIAQHAQECERLRRPVDTVWKALRRTGLLYHYMPKRYGGHERSLAEYVELVMPIAEACPSTAWAAGFCAEHNWLASNFPEEAQKEFFGKGRYIISPAVTNPPGLAVRVPGGFKVNGRWRYGSGVMNANWVLTMVMIEGENPPYPHWVAFPASQAQVLDTWHVDGLVGTGSNDIVAKDVFIPEHMIVSMAQMEIGESPGAKLHGNPIFKIPTVPFLTLTISPVIVGGARGAVNILRERLLSRKIYGTQTRFADQTHAQLALGRADLLVRTAELMLRTLANELLELAKRGDSANAAARKAIVAQNALCGRLAREAVHIASDFGGSSAHALSDPLQRMMRDVQMACAHLGHEYDTLVVQHGASLLGLEPGPTTARLF